MRSEFRAFGAALSSGRRLETRIMSLERSEFLTPRTKEVRKEKIYKL